MLLKDIYALLNRLGQDGETFPQGILLNGERGCDLDRLAPGANRGEKQQAFMEAAFDNLMRQVRGRLFSSWQGHLQATHQAAAAKAPYSGRMLPLNFAQTIFQNFPHPRGIGG